MLRKYDRAPTTRLLVLDSMTSVIYFRCCSRARSNLKEDLPRGEALCQKLYLDILEVALRASINNAKRWNIGTESKFDILRFIIHSIVKRCDYNPPLISYHTDTTGNRKLRLKFAAR